MAKETKAEMHDKIVAQAISELQFDRNYKQGKVKNWKINEDLYYGRKTPTDDARANVDLGQAGSFVHSILSKIDNPLTFKILKRKLAQLQRVEQLNALKNIDSERDNWDIKDLVGKKQGVVYGRAIYGYSADSEYGYCPHLDNVDVYDFLIDPSAGGIDIEKAYHLGRYGVVKSRQELEEGADNGIYLKDKVAILLEGGGNADTQNQETTNQINRTAAQNVYQTNKEMQNDDKFKFWEWYTTYEGVRYYLLLNEKGATAIRLEPLANLFKSEMWPFWSWAAFMDLTEFWTPSYLDYVRELFMAQNVSIDQMLDNAEEYNKPMKAINVDAIENLAELKYRKNGYIKFKKDFDITKVYQVMRPQSISTPLEVFAKLEAIAEKNSGVTAGAQGDAANNSGSKATIYEGNEANAADRFGLLNKSYSFGYKRFAKLWENGVREHLIKKVAVDILGPNGVEAVEVSRRDLFKKGDEYGVMVESSNAELALSQKDRTMKMDFLYKMASIPVAQGSAPIQNPKKAYEIMAETIGFDPETIKQLQDTSSFGTSEILSEADRDIEAILEGEQIALNQSADTAYKQRFVDYMQDNQEDITNEQFRALAEYVMKLDQIIIRNMVRRANDRLMTDQMMALTMQPNGGVGASQQPSSTAPDTLPLS